MNKDILDDTLTKGVFEAAECVGYLVAEDARLRLLQVLDTLRFLELLATPRHHDGHELEQIHVSTSVLTSTMRLIGDELGHAISEMTWHSHRLDRPRDMRSS